MPSYNIPSYSLPDTINRESVADWVEFFVTLTKGGLAKSELSAYMESSSGNEIGDDIIDSVWQELEYREYLYGEDPPFAVEGVIVRSLIDWENLPEYMTCLIFALEGNPKDSLSSGMLFERITEQAVKNFISGKCLRTRSPRKVSVTNIAKAVNERFNYEPPSYRQDRDLDVVAWKDFGDDRSSQVVVLIQCAAGQNWQSKLKDLNLDAWTKYIHFACRPIKGFSIPVIISDKTKLEEHSTDGGIIIDRTRIYRNVIINKPLDNLRKELKVWCKKRIAEMVE
ncbi:MAG: hypothetical protein ABR913_02200 [Sedimentisphaerales bacterium]|jgi:hypothetical protein